MSEAEVNRQVMDSIGKRTRAIHGLAHLNKRIGDIGNRLIEIGTALERGVLDGADDPLSWQLRDLGEDVAGVLQPERLGALLEERRALGKQVAELTAYLRSAGIDLR